MGNKKGDINMMRFCISASAVAVAAMLSAPAQAQDQSSAGNAQAGPAATAAQSDAGTPASAGTEDIVVTAQFRSQNLQDTPLAITAVTAATLEARGQTSVYEVAAQAPNVTLAPQGQAYGSGIVAYIRGIGQNDSSYALEPGVGIYVDDVYYSTLTGSLLDLMDLDRVEVLRGPQGTLAGKNSIGGAIKLFSSKPNGSSRGSFQATYGSFDRIEARGFADLTVIPDKLFARISGVTKNRDGYVKRLDYGQTHPGSGVPTSNVGDGNNYGTLGTLGGISYAAARLALRWTPSSNIEVNVAGDYTNDKSESGASVLLSATDQSVNYGFVPYLVNTNTGLPVPYDCRFVPNGPNSCDTITGYNRKYITYSNFLDASAPNSQSPFKPVVFTPRSQLNSYGFQGTIDWDVADKVQIKSITGYRNYAAHYAHDEDGSPLAITQVSYNQNHRQFSQELRVNAAFGDVLDMTVGGFYFDSASKTQARVDLNYLALDVISGPDDINVSSKAVFAHAAFHATDAFNISGGIRYTDDKKTYFYRRSNPDGSVIQECAGYPFSPPSPPNCIIFGLNGVPDTAADQRVDWRVAVDYRFSDELLAYAQVSTGYKGGGVNPYPYFGPGPLNQIKSFGPETVLTYEVGLKADLFDRRARINSAVFLNKYSDIILRLQACPTEPCDQPNNVGKADVFGFEVEAQVYPVDNLSLDGSFSYLDFDYKRFNGVTPIQINMVTPYTPKYKWSGGIQYELDIGSGKFITRFDGSYQSSVFTDAVNGPRNKIDGYFIANGRLTYRTADDDWQISLEVQNIFEKYYFLTKLDSPSNYVSGQPGLPRTWAVTLKKSF